MDEEANELFPDLQRVLRDLAVLAPRLKLLETAVAAAAQPDGKHAVYTRPLTTDSTSLLRLLRIRAGVSTVPDPEGMKSTIAVLEVLPPGTPLVQLALFAEPTKVLSVPLLRVGATYWPVGAYFGRPQEDASRSARTEGGTRMGDGDDGK